MHLWVVVVVALLVVVVQVVVVALDDVVVVVVGGRGLVGLLLDLSRLLLLLGGGLLLDPVGHVLIRTALGLDPVADVLGLPQRPLFLFRQGGAVLDQVVLGFAIVAPFRQWPLVALRGIVAGKLPAVVAPILSAGGKKLPGK